LISDVKPWGRWATLGLFLAAMLVGQMTALTAVMWWDGLELAQMPNLASDGRRRDPSRLHIDPGSDPPTDADGAAGRCQPADYLGLTLTALGCRPSAI
jgi:hypothetical protein